MKKFIMMLWTLIAAASVQAQSEEVQQLLLNVEKLAQLKQLLSDMKKGYQIVNSGYSSVKDLSKGNFTLHKTFLDGLMQVSPAVRNYSKVADIIEYQLLLVKEYRKVQARFTRTGIFNPSELDYIETVHYNLLQGSLQHLDELSMVITASKLRMSDDERLKAIDRIHGDMADKLTFLRHFHNNTAILALQREKEQQDLQRIKTINGITK